MTHEECWAEIAKCTKSLDWAGVRAGAAALAKLGEPESEAASAVAWAIRTGSVPETVSYLYHGWPPHPSEDHRVWWRFVLKGPGGTVERSHDTVRDYTWKDAADAEIIAGWQWLVAERMKFVRHYGAER